MLPEPLFFNIHMYILYSARGYHKDRFLYDILCKIQICAFQIVVIIAPLNTVAKSYLL